MSPLSAGGGGVVFVGVLEGVLVGVVDDLGPVVVGAWVGAVVLGPSVGAVVGGFVGSVDEVWPGVGVVVGFGVPVVGTGVGVLLGLTDGVAATGVLVGVA
jgi:hypothetical protein